MADFLDQVVSLRDAVTALRSPPAAVGGNHALRDAWNAILGQNYQAMAWARDLDDLSDAANWRRDESDKTLGLEPARWGMAASTLVSRVRLGLWEALSRYLKFRWVWVQGVIRVGTLGAANAPIGSKKAVEDARKKQDEAHAAELKKVEAAHKAIAGGIQAGLEAMRDRLGALIEDVGALVHALQKAEEARLRGRLAGPPPAPPGVKAQVAALLATMADLRTNLKNHAGSPTEAATLARTWVKRRQGVESALA